MLSETFWVFQNKLIYKEKCGETNSHEIKTYEVFQVCISVVYDSFILQLSISINKLALVLALHCYCRDNVKHRLLSKNFFQRKRKYLEKITSSSYYMKEKTFIEASCIYNINTGEKIFCNCCFGRFVRCLDSDRLKTLKCTLVCKSLLLLL